VYLTAKAGLLRIAGAEKGGFSCGLWKLTASAINLKPKQLSRVITAYSAAA
jgi:hypothetical protein